jgi:hypothetical protein
MDRSQVQDWLDRYVGAWRANQRQPIEALFTEDAVYRWAPFGEKWTVRGRTEIAESWLATPDDPGSWEASYAPFAVDGQRAVAVGRSRYLPRDEQGERVFHNVFLLEFEADGRCTSFTELYMREQPPQASGQ